MEGIGKSLHYDSLEYNILVIVSLWATFFVNKLASRSDLWVEAICGYIKKKNWHGKDLGGKRVVTSNQSLDCILEDFDDDENSVGI